jgi:hypothetical protein
MKDYVKYAGRSDYREIDLSRGVTTLALMSVMELINTAGWEVRDQLTPYVDMYYAWPPYKGGSMYRPYTCYNNSNVIGYYDPDLGPPPDPGPGWNVTWFEVQGTAVATVQHTADKIATVYPGWTGTYFTPTNGWPYGIRVSNFHGGPLYNGQEFAPNSSMGQGGLTYYGGYRVRTAEYNGYYAEMDLYDHPSYRFSADVIFGFPTPVYSYKFGGYTRWHCFANKYQLIMVAYETCQVGDMATDAKGFLISVPYLSNLIDDKEDIINHVDYCGVACGALSPGSGYAGGDFSLHSNMASSRIRLVHDFRRPTELAIPLEATYSPALSPYTVQDSGLQFPAMRCTQDLNVVNGSTEYPITNPAYLSLPRFPGSLDSLAQVVGNLWDCFAVTQYIPRGTEVTLDGKEWQCVMSQDVSGLGQTVGSIFALKEE